MIGMGAGSGNNKMQRLTGTNQSLGTGTQVRGEGSVRNHPGLALGNRSSRMMTATLPRGVSLSPGQLMNGRVIGKREGQYDIQFGRFTMSTRSSMSFNPGQRIQVAFTGQQNGNQVQLQFVKSFELAQVNNNDLAQTLTQMKMPVNEKSMVIARGMVEFGVPLTPGNISEFTKALSSLPRPMTSTDMAAASFLKMSDLPLTPKNIMTLSNFLEQNPMLGTQMCEMAKFAGLRGKSTKSMVDQKNQEVMDEIKNTMSKHVIEPKHQDKQEMMRNLKNLAREEGVEGFKHGFGGQNMEDGWELMQLMRKVQDTPAEKLAAFEKESLTQMKQMAGNIEQNLMAQALINRGRPESDLTFYFMQIPLKMNDDESTAEVRVEYYEDGNGDRVVDPENTHIEFDVCTENLGELHVDLKVSRGNVNVEIGTKMEGFEEFIEQFIPILRKNLDEMGYFTENIITGFYEEMRKPLIERENFEKMEKVDVST
jgi:hypothetical protein